MFYQKSIQETVKELETDTAKGLSQKEAEKRLSKYGPNAFAEKKKPPLIFKFFEQFKNLLVIILIIAAIISAALGETIDAVAIAVIVVVNAILGFVQEMQAEKTLESLKEKEVLYALVLRNESVEKIPFKNIVPGDILILEEGAKIPADGRVIESFSLRIDESILTGEPAAVNKNSKDLPQKSIPLADRTNIVYKDTQVLAGRGKAVITATGKGTETGKIAAFLEEAKPVKTPLTIELEKVGSMLTVIIGVIATVMFGLNLVRQITLVESLLISISLSVAAIPEGLPAIITIVLSLGVKRLAEKKTVVKKLAACETLGAVRIIATDKTGTLTQNKINVVKIYLSDGSYFSVKGEGYNTEGVFFNQKKNIIDPAKNSSLLSLLKAGVLASNAAISHEEVLGDTTEAALLVTAARAKINIRQARKAEPKIYEVPFSAERKMMSTVVEINETGDHLLYAKGAPEVILEKCQIEEKKKKQILSLVQKMAGEGLRSLAVAKRSVEKSEVKKALEENILEEADFEFMGLLGMQDPLRPEVKQALCKAKVAGIHTIMITGDHKQTALSIARQAGILKEKSSKVLTEEDIEHLTKKELVKEIKKGVNVFARISPMGKLKIIEAIKSIPGTQVAVTGDGVNDAPALRASHIGVAMGLTGTDITREVADLVITDDNYATIVDAVREGRVIFANLVKFIRYLISCNISEVIVVAAGVIFGTPLPLMPIQILWINLITDGLPALALGVDPPEPAIMEKPPRDLSQGIIHKKRWAYMTAEGIMMGSSVFLLFIFGLSYHSYPQAQTMAFSVLGLSQLVHAFNNRSTRKSLFKIGFFSNKFLVLAAVLSTVLQILVVQTSWGNTIFKTEALNLNSWAIIGLASLFPLLFVEVKKKLRASHILP